MQKTVTTDFLTKKRVVNKGIAPQYYVENSHEAIIPREIFMQVQEEMQRRANLETGTGKKRVYSGKYALSHLVYCAHCGDIFRRSQWFMRQWSGSWSRKSWFTMTILPLSSSAAPRQKYRCEQKHRAGAPSGASFSTIKV